MKKIEINKLLFILAAVCGLAIIMLFFFTPLIQSTSSDELYEAKQIIFGYTVKREIPIVGTISYEIFKFSIMNLLTYIAVIAAILFAFVSTFLRKKSSGILGMLSILLFIVAGAFFLLTIKFIVPGKNANEFFNFFGSNFKENFKLASGAIASSVLSFVAAFCCIIPSLLSFSKKRK